MSRGIPAPVERLIINHIDSVEQLEVLLLLQRSAVPWTAAAVAADLRIDATSAARRLQGLTEAGFVESAGDAFAYDAQGQNHDAVQKLAATYQERRVSIITLIFTKPERNDPVRALAAAFRVRADGV